MYKIIGVDQKEYGPISAEQMRQWFAEGRVNAQTLVWSEASNNWKPFGAYAEFSDLVRTAPPPLGGPAGAIPPLTAGGGFGPGGSREEALQRVNGPAIGLMVTAIIGFLSSFSVFWIEPLLESLANTNPEFEQISKALSVGTFGMLQVVFSLALSALIFFGALKMKRLESHGLANAAAWIAIIPCVSPCCVIGLPFGIWAVIVLNKPEVKSQFQ